MGLEWNPERVGTLITEWQCGKTVTQLAIEFHTTRNSIVGKLFRLRRAGAMDDSGRAATMPAQNRPRRPRVVRPRTHKNGRRLPSPERIEPPPIIEGGGVSILDLESRHCRHINGYGPDGLARYCGAQVQQRTHHYGNATSSYCVYHGRIYYNPL